MWDEGEESRITFEHLEKWGILYCNGEELGKRWYEGNQGFIFGHLMFEVIIKRSIYWSTFASQQILTLFICLFILFACFILLYLQKEYLVAYIKVLVKSINAKGFRGKIIFKKSGRGKLLQFNTISFELLSNQNEEAKAVSYKTLIFWGSGSQTWMWSIILELSQAHCKWWPLMLHNSTALSSTHL